MGYWRFRDAISYATTLWQGGIMRMMVIISIIRTSRTVLHMLQYCKSGLRTATSVMRLELSETIRREFQIELFTQDSSMTRLAVNII